MRTQAGFLLPGGKLLYVVLDGMNGVRIIQSRSTQQQGNDMRITHLEVVKANGGKSFGIEDGQLLKVIHETPKFFFVETFGTKEKIKVSKLRKIACHFGTAKTAPLFNIDD
jgi:hypothetical protein